MIVHCRCVLLALLCLPLSIAIADTTDEYSPHAFKEHPRLLLWGDTHVHSSFSMDANSAGNTRLAPDAAYRFAKGEKVVANSGMTAQLVQPLDFLLVSDHAEYMGLLPALRAHDQALLSDPVGKRLSAGLDSGLEGGMATFGELIGSLMKNEPIVDNADFKRNIWQQITEHADAANDPGRFTALIGFEWTSMPGGDNLHRVVVYGDHGDKASQRVPVSAFDGDRPEDLWAFMEAYARDVGGKILAIPHNANMSNGRMFAITDSEGNAFDRAYSERRAAHEPIVEVTQIKGDGETHPLLSPDDDFADFETWDFGNLNVLKTVPKGENQIEYEYARSALKLGLAQEASSGANPFKFGMIGSTDAHTSLATGAEDNYWGKVSSVEPAARAQAPDLSLGDAPSEILFETWDFVASGYAAVWATENTREAIFNAMQRREVYATSGSRISVRFFGGWEFADADASSPDLASVGYAKGVPMGGDLRNGKGAPSFLVFALKDPDGANLDRIQIVKGWREADGTLREQVYDVALSDGRVAKDGKVPTVGSTVNAKTATWSNSIGDTALSTVWADPNFEVNQLAFYYARVIEIPTPRWNVYDAVRLGADVPERVPTEVQDRAYTSPIWYTP